MLLGVNPKKPSSCLARFLYVLSRLFCVLLIYFVVVVVVVVVVVQIWNFPIKQFEVAVLKESYVQKNDAPEFG